MNPKRSNRTLFFTLIIMGIIGAIVISNVLFTMVTHTHLRSGINIKEYKDSSISNTNVIKAKRGTIYDRSGEVIAQDEDSYTIIAYLDKSRKGIGDKPAYVADVRKTARLLATKLDMSEDDIYQKLSDAKEKGSYQTYLGTKGKNLSTNVKEGIESLELQGISFEKSVKRNYPNGIFASQLIGFAQYSDTDEMLAGVQGLESTLNEYLTGTDGLETYQKDVNGNIIPGTPYTKEYEQDGNNVTLTLDRNVQLTLQSSLQKTVEKSGKIGWGIVMEVETGKILGYASYPTYDLNTREGSAENGTNVPAMYLYEPGSVMKGITYAAAVDSGVYPYDTNFSSGTFYYNVDGDGKIYRTSANDGPYAAIQDALGKNHGTLSFDKGFTISSNIGICELLSKYMNPEVYKEYVEKFGFVKQVAIPFVNNEAGGMSWTYPSDKLSVGFGQAIQINALQMAQAYTAILNDGKMVRPYVVERITDANSNKIIKQYGTKQVGTPISQKTSEYMRSLMKTVVEDSAGTGQAYRLDDVSVIAKTGTGEVATAEKGYNSGIWTSSVMLAAPYDDPKVMVYYCFQGSDIINFDRSPMKDVMRAALVAANVSSGANASEEKKTYSEWKDYTMPSITNHTLEYAKNKLVDMKVGQIVIGDGTSVVKQYPASNSTIVSNQNVFILTDGAVITMPNMSGWTKKDITAFWELTGISVEMDGSGVVVSQDIAEGKTIDKDSIIKVKME
ncbi:penicillin-binding protein [Amedibacillus sp. YH-ame10]